MEHDKFPRLHIRPAPFPSIPVGGGVAQKQFEKNIRRARTQQQQNTKHPFIFFVFSYYINYIYNHYYYYRYFTIAMPVCVRRRRRLLCDTYERRYT